MPPITLEDWRNAATIASAGISLIALFRPEWQKLFARFSGKLLIYPVAERLEIGYSLAGPTAALEMTLRANGRDFFVRDARLEITRQKDGARYPLSWGAFRPPAVIGSNQPATFEVPAGFLLEPKATRRLNVVFQDLAVRDEITDALVALRDKWWAILREERLYPPPTASGEEESHRSIINETYDRFSQEDSAVSTWTTLQRRCYWQAGEYLAEVKFNTTEPEQVFEFRRNFSLSQEESERLYANAIPMLRQTVGFTDMPFFFANPKTQASSSGARKS